MKIARKREYRPLFASIGLGVVVSSALAMTLDFSAYALSLPQILNPSQTGQSQQKSSDDRNSNTSSGSRDTNKTAASPSVTPTPTPSPAAQPSSTPAVSAAQSTPSRQTVSVRPAQAATPPQQTDTSEQQVAATNAAVSKTVIQAQASRSVAPTVYTSDKIPTVERDQLYKVALIVAGAGAALYAASYAKVIGRWLYRTMIEIPKTVTG